MKKILFVLMFILILNTVLALENKTAEEKAIDCINEAKSSLEYLARENFTIQRANDSLTSAEKAYLAQLSLKQKNDAPDFSMVLPYCQEVKNIEGLAVKTKDNFLALIKFYHKKEIPNANFSSVDELISQINGEITSERYEQALELIDQTYSEIINIGTSSTTLNLFYKATTRGLRSFIVNNKITILVILALIIILYFVYRQKISKLIIKRKIKHLETEKRILREMISKLQNDYFQEGKISEGTYNIRTKKFAELIRDIDRQIPMLQEELERITHERVKEKTKGKER